MEQMLRGPPFIGSGIVLYNQSMFTITLKVRKYLFYKGRKGDSEEIGYLSMITKIVSGRIRIQTHICSKTLLLKQPAKNYLCGFCTQQGSPNATSSFSSCLLASFMLFHSPLLRHICTSVLLPWNLYRLISFKVTSFFLLNSLGNFARVFTTLFDTNI